MARIPFDIKYRNDIENNKVKVFTRSGQQVTDIRFNQRYWGLAPVIFATTADGCAVITDYRGLATAVGGPAEDDLLVETDK